MNLMSCGLRTPKDILKSVTDDYLLTLPEFRKKRTGNIAEEIILARNDAIRLLHGHGFTAAAIGRFLNVSEDTVQNYLRGKKKIVSSRQPSWGGATDGR